MISATTTAAASTFPPESHRTSHAEDVDLELSLMGAVLNPPLAVCGGSDDAPALIANETTGASKTIVSLCMLRFASPIWTAAARSVPVSLISSPQPWPGPRRTREHERSSRDTLQPHGGLDWIVSAAEMQVRLDKGHQARALSHNGDVQINIECNEKMYSSLWGDINPSVDASPVPPCAFVDRAYA